MWLPFVSDAFGFCSYITEGAFRDYYNLKHRLRPWFIVFFHYFIHIVFYDCLISVLNCFKLLQFVYFLYKVHPPTCWRFFFSPTANKPRDVPASSPAPLPSRDVTLLPSRLSRPTAASTVSTSELAPSSCRWHSVQPVSPSGGAFVIINILLLHHHLHHLPSRRKTVDGQVVSSGASCFTSPGFTCGQKPCCLRRRDRKKSPVTWPDQSKSWC